MTGAGSVWSTNLNQLALGQSGAGSLSITDGGAVSSGNAFFAMNAGSSATVNVTGAGSSWNTNTGQFQIGVGSNATVTVADGGSISSGDGYIAFSGSTSSATVTGANSRWNLGTRTLYAGYGGSGTLTIAEGGAVSSGTGSIGNNTNSIGTVTVTGAGSSWTTGIYNLFVGNSGTGTLTIAAGGAVTSGNVQLAKNASSTGTLNLNGTSGSRGVLTTGLVLANHGTELLTFDGGILKAAADTSDFLSGLTSTSTEIAAGGAFIDRNGYAVTIIPGLDGAGGLTKQGTGTLTLTGVNTYFGETVVSAGTLALSGSGSIASSSGLKVDGTFDISAINGNVSYVYGLSGTGTVALGGKSLSLQGASSSTFAGTLTGTGDFRKESKGTLTLTGDSSSFTGSTMAKAGTLVVSTVGGTTSGVLGGEVSVLSGGTLQGAGGTITGSVAVASGGILSNSSSGEGLTAGSLVLSAGAITNVTLVTPTTAHAIFTTVGDLTVNGTLNASGAPTYGVGVYRVFTSGGTLTDNGLTLGTSQGGNYITTLSVGTSDIDLQVTTTGPSNLQYWSADGVSQGSSGTWTASNPWLNPDNTTSAWSGNTAVFSGTAGTVSVEGTQSFATLEFLTSGYVLANGTNGSLDLGTGGQVWAEGANVSATISATITGTGGLTKVGAGTIVLSGANTYQGGTAIQAGTLQVSADANLGDASGAVAFQGGTLASTASFTSARSMSLASAGGTIDTATATALTLSGSISGSGGLTKAGEGTLVLTGSNTYSGVTTIAAGILQLGDGGTTGSIVGDVVNNASLVFNRSDTYTFPGTISGTGSVAFTGGGTVLFSNPGAYTGPIAVSGATVYLETGSETASTFTMNTGGRLGGTGTIGGLVVNNGGVAAPGNSPGTIAIAGTVTFNSGSVYQVDVTPEGAHDLLTATGAVSLSSGARVAVLAEAGVYAANTTYAIITTTDTLSGSFGAVTSDYAFLTPSLSYDAQNVFLTLAYNEVDFVTYAHTANQAGVAVGAQALGSGNAVFDAILELPGSAVASAFDALSGEIYASANTVIQQQSIYVREAVGARLRQPATGATSATGGPATAPLGAGLTPTLWAQGFGGWGSSFSDGNAASITNTIGGFLIGADVAVADTGRAGVFGGFSQSNFDVTARGSSGSMDTYDVGLYAGAKFGPVAARGGLAYAWNDMSADRTIAFPGLFQSTSAGYSTNSVQVFGELGYAAKLGAFDLEPFVGLAYLNIAGATFRESGGSAALSVDIASMNTTYSTLGVRAATSVDLNGRALTPSVTLGWQHAFGDTTPTATMLFTGGTLPFQVAGVPIAEDTLLMEAGLAYALSDLTALSVNYNGQFADTAAQNAFTARFQMRF